MSNFLTAAWGGDTPTAPIWLMRQAGRYLPEYRKLKERYGFWRMGRVQREPAHRLEGDLGGDLRGAAELLDKLTDVTIGYLRMQVGAGAQAVQLLHDGLGGAHIFNLGPGVLPSTPPGAVARLADTLHRFSRSAGLATASAVRG